jgi:hypothetical protein
MNPKNEGHEMNVTTNIPINPAFQVYDAGNQHRWDNPPRTAGEAIQLAVDAVDNLALKPLSAEAVSPLSQARAILALLVNCYVHQIYSSRNAAALAARDPHFPWLWWENFPDAAALKRFRLENHAAIHRCLTLALELLAAQKKFAGVLTRFSGAQFAEEASRRITMAAFVDSVELEED